uniref:receptor protein-tyrosine kinase n=1 Tax=Nothobranchius furzeri TaxID=105023 RepID=A0A8C6M898_NOTFU
MPDPPTLNTNGTQRLNKSDNLELTCRGRQHLRWTTPTISTRFSTNDCSGSGLFCTKLTITNATVNETGLYRCSYKDLKVEDGKTAVATHVFVNDYKVPFVPSDKECELVFIREGERVVIPCRGSVEELNVTLNTKYPIKEIHPDGKDSVWDARTGFTVPAHLISYAGVVSCQTRIGNQTFKSPLYIVAVVGYMIYNLTLTPVQQRLSVGERLELSCTAHTELNVDGGSRPFYKVSHKKKLWNSLVLSNTLIVENVTADHTGYFTCTASSGQMEKSASIYFTVYEKPFIDLKEPWFKVWEANVGEQTSIPVKYSAYPEPDFRWLKNGQALKENYRVKMKNDALVIRKVTAMDAGNYTLVLTNKITQRRSFQLMVNGSYLKIQEAKSHALYRCLTANKVGEDSRTIVFRVTRNLEVSVFPSDKLMEEDNVVLSCKADMLFYSSLAWFLVTNTSESEQVESTQPCRSLTLQPRPLSQVVETIQHGTNITVELMLFNVSRQDEGLYACQVKNNKTGESTCILHRLEAARIRNNFTDQKVNVSSTTALRCDAVGTPAPTVVWTKNNHTVKEGSGVILRQNNLIIQRVKKEDSGLYTCTACNSRGCDASQTFLTVEGADEKTNVELIVPIGSVVIAMFFWLLIVFVIRGRKRPNRGDLKTGYLSMILDSEDMPMDEQCERLTYDANKWEFPRDRLKLGEPLGRGAFGQVVEAAAFGIEKATTCTTVAVKMLKEGATSSEYRALMSELKILIHIGHHLNVVNLLGACTKPGGPLMVIVEYCKNGNLSSYLKSKRGEYSPYKPIRLLSSVYNLHLMIPESSVDDHLTMEDLISYSFQVAKGMEFLSSRKCIHRDLAARNILLSENNVVKICDFGLARDVYKDPDYVRKGDARLPLKWMAPETIFDRVYTTQSDVWSFGVLLWEIFSLGASPYPGVCIDESFCRRLKEGTRMRPPEYATTEIYQTMLDCWMDCATDRPMFAELVEHLGNLLQASARQVCSSQVKQKGAPCPQIPEVPAVGLKSERPLSVKTFEDIPMVHSSGHTDSGMGFSPTVLNQQLQLLRSKSKESVASESSNQTSGYQSGYHSDDTDAPIYANEEVILKHTMLKKSPLPKTPEIEIRYSTPPV